MQTITQKLAVLICVCICLMTLFISCCDDDNPVRPSHNDVDYRVYFTDAQWYNTYYAYHPTTGVIDSFTLPYNSSEAGMAISPDGKTMYLAPPGYIVEIGLDSYTVVAEHPTPTPGGGLIASPDGKYLAVMERDFYIVDLADFSVAYKDTNDHYAGRFTPDGGIFVCAGRDSAGPYAVELDIANGFQERRVSFADGSPFLVVPNHDNTKWYLLLCVHNDVFWFEVYDLLADSTTFRSLLRPGFGDIEITPDGRYVIFSQRGSEISAPPPPYFTIFDTKVNRITFHVSTSGLGQEGSLYVPVGGLCVTPDGKHLVCLSAPVACELLDFALEDFSFANYILLGYDRWLTNLTCQSSP